MDRTEWVLLMFSDSALPVGGFVASCGLEAAIQMQAFGASSLLEFLELSLTSCAHQTFGFITRAITAIRKENGDGEEVVGYLRELDLQYESVICANQAAKRASLAQVNRMNYSRELRTSRLLSAVFPM